MRPQTGLGTLGGMGPTLLQRLARRAVLARLARLTAGELTLIEDGASRRFGPPAAEAGLRATVRVDDPRFYLRVAWGGAIGAGEAYRDGLWSADDLPALVRLLARDARSWADLERGSARLGHLFHRLRHRSRSNTRAGSRRNIAQHYDLGNDFFERMLDATWNYSCAVFPHENASLEEASRFRNDLICRKLGLHPKLDLLEIGCGWGGLALHAAGRYGCRVTAVTLSQRQFDLAQRRVAEAGLRERVHVVLADYRDLPALLGRRFDRLVSVEMIEAVGERFLDGYFRTCSELLAPHGAMLLQAIVIADRFYAHYRRSTDFIQRHVFPGGFLPSLGHLCAIVGHTPNLHVAHLEDLTAHYPPTLRAWRHRLLAHRQELLARGYSNELLRLWEFYLAYCEGGFLERTVGDVQLLLAGPDWARAPRWQEPVEATA